MVEFRDLQFLHALSQHRHFARAAETCGVSQPAFSTRIQKLEAQLGVPLVRRDNRFQGLTPEGEKLLRDGMPLMDGMRALEQELTAQKGLAAGVLRLGVIPTATIFAGSSAVRLASLFPDIQTRVESASSLVIQQRLIEGTLDAGVSYQDGVDSDLLRSLPLYEERYSLLCPTAMAPTASDEISWGEAAQLPLALLDPSMQNRSILDRIFEGAGAVPRVVAETNALTSAMEMARAGHCATVIPEVMAQGFCANLEGTRSLRLTKPEVHKAVSLLVAARAAPSPVFAALVQALDLQN